MTQLQKELSSAKNIRASQNTPEENRLAAEYGIAVLEAAMLAALLSIASLTAVALSGIAISSTFKSATESLCGDSSAASSCSEICNMRNEETSLSHPGCGSGKDSDRLTLG